MISFDRFERSLPALLDDLAGPRLPDYANDLFARTAATRQRPGWSFPEGWFFMSALARRLAGVPVLPLRIGVAVALLLITAIVGVLIAGSLTTHRPPPFGPAGNGQIVYVDSSGRIVAGELGSGTSTVLIANGRNLQPVYSQDGTQFVFLRSARFLFDVVVASADGSNVRTISPSPIAQPAYLGWSPRGDQLLVYDSQRGSQGQSLLLFDTTKAGPPTDLSAQLGVQVQDVGLGYNFRSTAAFRPPTGDEIVFVAGSAHDTLMAAKADGSGVRTLLDPASSPIDYLTVHGAEWSPNGSMLVVMLTLPAYPDHNVPFLLDADGTNLRPLSALSLDPTTDTNSPLWSPDGGRIAFQYWTRHLTGDDGGANEDFHPLQIVDVASGRLLAAGPTSSNGFSWSWSPDGTKLLAVVGGTSDVLIIDATTGLYETAPWKASESGDWQRVASAPS